MNPNDDPLADVFGNLKAQIESLGRTYQTASNQWAALQAQNADIANGRWTLNNAVYQFNQLQPVGQLAVMAAVAYLAAQLIRKG